MSWIMDVDHFFIAGINFRSPKRIAANKSIVNVKAAIRSIITQKLRMQWILCEIKYECAGIKSELIKITSEQIQSSVFINP